MQGTPERIHSGVPQAEFTAPTRKVLLPLNHSLYPNPPKIFPISPLMQMFLPSILTIPQLQIFHSVEGSKTGIYISNSCILIELP